MTGRAADRSTPLAGNLERDVAYVGRLDVVPTILEVICRTTGLGFSAVARVTEERWIAAPFVTRSISA